MLWYIELKFCIWLCLTILQIKFHCRQFASIFVGVMPLLERKMMKYIVFRTFLLHALTYWAEILLLFYCTIDQVWVSSIFVGVMPLLELRILKYTIFCTFLLHALVYWAEILHLTLFYWTIDQVWVSSIFVGVMPLLELKILKIHNILHFSLTCFDILSWNFAHDFV